MGKTFCSKHERFYEKACEYCVAPALPVVAVETVRNLPRRSHDLPMTTAEILADPFKMLPDCLCPNCKRAGGEALDKKPQPMPRARRALEDVFGKFTIDELFASPPMVQDAPYDPTKAPIGKPSPPWRSGKAERMNQELAKLARFANVDVLVQTCACGQCQVPEGETFVPKDSYDKHAYMSCEIFRRRPETPAEVRERFVSCFCGEISFVKEAYFSRDMVHHSASMEHRPQGCRRPRAWTR